MRRLLDEGPEPAPDSKKHFIGSRPRDISISADNQRPIFHALGLPEYAFLLLRREHRLEL